MLKNLKFNPTSFEDPCLCAVEQLNQISHIQTLDENYLVPDPESIMMKKPCWFDAYTLNKLISYKIIFFFKYPWFIYNQKHTISAK